MSLLGIATLTGLLLVALLLAGACEPVLAGTESGRLEASVTDLTDPATAVSPAHEPGLYAGPHLVPVVAGLALLFALDDPARDLARRNRSAASDDLAALVRPLGEWQVYVPLTTGILAAGLVAGDPAWREAGLRISTAIALTGGLSPLLKHSIGRLRPDEGRGRFAYDAFSHHGALPSGHTAMAFALATGISLEARRGWITYPLHGLAVLCGWSRLNDGEHWLSDVAAGALMGHAIARLAHDRMRWAEGGGPVFWTRAGEVGTGWRQGF